MFYTSHGAEHSSLHRKQTHTRTPIPRSVSTQTGRRTVVWQGQFLPLQNMSKYQQSLTGLCFCTKNDSVKYHHDHISQSGNLQNSSASVLNMSRVNGSIEKKHESHAVPRLERDPWAFSRVSHAFFLLVQRRIRICKRLIVPKAARNTFT